MKRQGFTLVELIFVIVIIGVLAAVAVPKYKDLKQNAEVKGVVKTTIDTASSAASAAVNAIDMNDGNASDTNLSNLVDVKGKGWSYTEVQGGGSYVYKNTSSSNAAAQIDFNGSARTVSYTFTCDNFKDTISQTKCKEDTNTSGSADKKTITF